MSRPTIQEIAALTARLRELSNAGRSADSAEVDRFLCDKREILDRITTADLPVADEDTDAAVQAAHASVADCLTRAEPSVEAAHVDEEPATADEAGFW